MIASIVTGARQFVSDSRLMKRVFKQLAAWWPWVMVQFHFQVCLHRPAWVTYPLKKLVWIFSLTMAVPALSPSGSNGKGCKDSTMAISTILNMANTSWEFHFGESSWTKFLNLRSTNGCPKQGWPNIAFGRKYAVRTRREILLSLGQNLKNVVQKQSMLLNFVLDKR